MKYLILAISLFVTAHAHAQANGNSFVSSVGLTGGIGSMSNKDNSIPKIDLAQAEASLDVGYRFGVFAPLVQASYRYVGQTTKADSVGGLNVAGSGYLAGAGLGLYLNTFSLSAIYDLMGKYDLAKSSSGGSKVSYGAPAGFHVALKYNWSGNWQAVFSFSQVDYKEKTSDSTKTDIAANPLKQSLYGVGIGYKF